MAKLLKNQFVETEAQYTVSLLLRKDTAKEYELKMQLRTVRATSKESALGMVLLGLRDDLGAESYDVALWVVGKTGD